MRPWPLLLALVACGPPPAPATLGEDLSGLWRIENPPPGWQPAELDVRDRGKSVDLYPLWDSSQEPGGGKGQVVRSPWQLAVRRPEGQAPALLSGELRVHLRAGASSCDRVSQATLALAPGGLELSLGEPSSDCTAPHSPPSKLRLRRK